jgi:hypothetical protein
MVILGVAPDKSSLIMPVSACVIGVKVAEHSTTLAAEKREDNK